jgi:hypothetical protein
MVLTICETMVKKLNPSSEFREMREFSGLVNYVGGVQYVLTI